MARSLQRIVIRGLEAAGVRPGDRLVVAVSGGVDSCVLLDLLRAGCPRLGVSLHVAHVHHGLRGRSADRDAAFVAETARRAGAPATVARLRPATRPRGVSAQTWARAERYARLEAIRRRTRSAWIATAHTRDDQAETVLLHLLRGTGARGLAGIPATRDRILRPLLEVTRDEIVAYAATHRLPFRDDPSNRSLAYARNRVRHRLLPLLAREYNPRIAECLASLAGQAREDDEALTRQAVDLFTAARRTRAGAIGVSAALLAGAPAAVARRVLQAVWSEAGGGAGLTRRHLDALRRLRSGSGRVGLPGGLQAWKRDDVLWIGPPVAPPAPAADRPPVEMRPGRWARWGPTGCRVRVRRVSGHALRPEATDRTRALLSADLLGEPLQLRGWRPGDRFQPSGMRGRKKLQDFFVDARVPREARARIPLLIAAGRIAWVVGHRVAEGCRWRGGSTACLAEVRYEEETHGVLPGSDPALGG